MAVLLTPPFLQFFDENGDPLAGGKIYSYSAGTTTKKATYTDETATHQNTNPIILDDAGRAVVFIQGSYRFDTYDANDVLIRSVDNVTSFATLESSNNAYFESFSGTGSKTSFTTSETLGTESAAIQVYVSTPVQSYVDNGDFASDTIWTKGSGWSIGAGVATATGAISTAISQTSPKTVTSGRAYRVTYTITRSAGGLIPSIGGANGTERTASGTYTEIVIAGSTQTIAFTGNGFTGTLDTVTIENIDTTGFQIQDPSTYTINGTALEFAVAPESGTNNIYVFAPTQLVGAAVAAADQAIAAQAAAEAAVITVQNQKIVWMGDWAAGTYNINEAVFYNGSSWIVTAATTIDTPSIASPDWDLLCEKGTDGTGGIPSPTASQVYSFLRASGTGTYTWFSGTTTVSAASTISLVGGNTTLVTIAGSGTINSFGTPVYSGDIRFVRFGTSTVTLTHSSSSGGIELPGAANISTTTGDYAIFVSSSTGTWRCWSYLRANGAPLALEDSSVSSTKLGGDVTASGKGLLTATTAAAQRAALGVNYSRTTPVSVGTGTAKDLTVTGGERITLHLQGVSLAASDQLMLQLGDSSGIKTSGYTGSASTLATSSMATAGMSASGFTFSSAAQNATTMYSGEIVLERIDSLVWSVRGVLSTGSSAMYLFQGNKTMTGPITTLRLTSLAASAFDAGTISVTEEYMSA